MTSILTKQASRLTSYTGRNIAVTAREYVHQTPEGSWRLTNSRVTLESVIQAYWEGSSPEGIQELFPTLSLGQIYGAIAFYLGNRAELDSYMKAQEAIWEQVRKKSEVENAPLLNRLRAQRKQVVGEETTS